MVGGTGSDAAFDLDWAGNIGMLTLSPGSRAGKKSKENYQSQELQARKQHSLQGAQAAHLGADGAHVLREKSNVGHTQPLGTDWKAVKAHALMLESKGHLQAALQHINDAIKQNGQPVDDMVQFQTDLQCRVNAAGFLNMQAVQRAIHRPCGDIAEGCENSDVCTPSITAFQKTLCFDSQNNHGTTGGTLEVMPPSVSSKTPQSMSTPVLPRAEASPCPSTPDTSSSEEHMGIGVRMQPGMQAETPVLLPTSSTEDADVLVNGDNLQQAIDDDGSITLCADNKVKVTQSDGSDESMSMCASEGPGQDTQTSRTGKRTARRASVRFSQVEAVAPTPPTPIQASPACHALAWSQVQDAGHTPYSAAVQSHVRFAADTVIATTQHTPAACSSVDSEQSDGQESGCLQALNSRNAGSTPAYCEQLGQSAGDDTPTSLQGEGRIASSDGAQARQEAFVHESGSMKTGKDLIAGVNAADASMGAPLIANKRPSCVDSDTSEVRACLTFKSDAVQGTAAGQRCTQSEDPLTATLAKSDAAITPAVLGSKSKPVGILKWPEQRSSLKSTEPASAPPVQGALFRTPAQGASFPSALQPGHTCTTGLPTFALHGQACQTIQEKNSASGSTPSGRSTCGSTPGQSTPALRDTSMASPSTGTPMAGGCHTAVGRREGTPAFGVVEGLDEPDSKCTGTECSVTPEVPAIEALQHDASSPATNQMPVGTCTAQHGPAVGGSAEAEGSQGDAMISPCWLQHEASGAVSASRAGGEGGFGSPVGPGAQWTGFDAVHAASEASTPSLARESTTSRSPAGFSVTGGLSPSAAVHSPLSPAAPVEPEASSSSQEVQPESTANDVWAQAESHAGFFQLGAMGPQNAAVRTPPSACSRDTAELLRESPATDDLLKESPSPQSNRENPHFLCSYSSKPPSPLQHSTAGASTTGDVQSEPQSSNSEAQANRSTDLPISPSAMAIIVAAGMAAGSPLTGESPKLAQTVPTLAANPPPPVTPTAGTRTALGVGKVRTPGRRELKAILSDSIAQHAIESLKEESDTAFATARADHKQQRKHQSTTVLTPVRRSRRSQAQANIPIADKLNASGWAYSPNPVLQNRTLSRAEEELLESMAQLNVKGK